MKEEGVIIRSTGSWYNIKTISGKIYQGRLRGKFKNQGLKVTNPLAVGDKVLFVEEDNEENSVVITDIIDRKNYFVRQSPRKKAFGHILAANIDQAVLVCTLRLPRTSVGFIDRFLINCESFRIPAVIIFHKKDLYKEDDLAIAEGLSKIYESLGYKCIIASSVSKDGLNLVEEALLNKLSLITGHSGSGKSTMINALIPELEIKTQEISDYSAKGKHTTTFAEIFEINNDSLIIDSPGIKEIGFHNLSPTEIPHYLPEFRKRLNKCKYDNCTHTHEPNCAIIEAVKNEEIARFRYDHYLSMLDGDDFKLNPKFR